MAPAGLFRHKHDQKPARSALDEAKAHAEHADPITGWLEKLATIGIEGRWRIGSAGDIATNALAEAKGDREKAIELVVHSHLLVGAGGGFVTGLGGFFTMPIAMTVNVVEFYTLATRMVAAIAHLRGYDLADSENRSAVLFTIVGAHSEDILAKAAESTVGGRVTAMAFNRLPAPALVLFNKAVGFRLIRSIGENIFERVGRGLPLFGGAFGAAVDAYMIHRIAEQARAEFPLVKAARPAAA